MPTAWLSGFQYRPVRNRYYPRRAQHGPPHELPVQKLVLHTTEGPNVAAAFSAYDSRAGRYRGGVHPHATVDPSTGERYQHCPLTRGSYALKRGDTHGVIQVEIRAYAHQSHLWAPDVNAWIGREVVRPILDSCPGIPLDDPLAFLGEDSGLLAAPWNRGKARVSPTDWYDTFGIIGHQHPPWDDHWDPGKINIAAIMDAARPTTDTEGLPAVYDVQRDSEVNATWAVWDESGHTYVRYFTTDRPGATDQPGGAWILREQMTIHEVNPDAGPYA